jgi:hypothetical protein
MPPGAVIDQDGNLVEQPRQEGETDDVYERCQEMADIAYGGKPW